MVLEVSEKDKIAYYWLSNEEKEDEAFRESLKPDYRKRGGRITRSGDPDHPG